MRSLASPTYPDFLGPSTGAITSFKGRSRGQELLGTREVTASHPGALQGLWERSARTAGASHMSALLVSAPWRKTPRDRAGAAVCVRFPAQICAEPQTGGNLRLGPPQRSRNTSQALPAAQEAQAGTLPGYVGLLPPLRCNGHLRWQRHA